MSRGKWAMFLLAAGLTGLAFWMFRVGPDIDVVISKGTPASQVGNLLAGQGVIKSPLLFKVLAKLTRLDRSLKPGTYHLRRSMSSIEALWRLHRGGMDYVTVSIPEGWRASQIAARLEDLGVCPADEFLEYVMDKKWEGYLFPTTYFLTPGMGAAKTAEIMHDEFQRHIAPKLVNIASPLLTPERVMVLASIVEREAVKPQERPLIARVYLNRLEKHWALEADPTVQYALGFWKKNLSYHDLDIQSPFNTYRNGGLPPGPICSPSLSSVLAVLSPAKTDAMYFVADTNGGHTFSATFQEHLKNKEKMKAELRRQRREARLKAKQRALQERDEPDSPGLQTARP